MRSYSIRGLYHGGVELPEGASLSQLKDAICAQLAISKPGLTSSMLKVLAGGKHLNDDAKSLDSYGVSPQKTIMVLQQEAPAEVQLQDEAMKRVRAVVAAAASGSAAAVARAHNYGSDDEDGRALSRNRLPNGRVGAQNGAQNGSSDSGSNGHSSRHRHGQPRLELTNQDGVAMDIPDGDSAALAQGIMLHDKGKACLRDAADTAVRLRREALAVVNNETAAIGGVATEADAAAADDSSMDTGAEESKGSSALEGSCAAAAPGAGTGAALPEHVRRERVAQAAAEAAKAVRMSRVEALGYFLAAEEAFGRCDPKYLEMADNYAYLCLDTVWLLFLTKDMGRLPLAMRLLSAAESGFRRSHGPGLERLTALKGEHCAERALYVRLHLLQGVVAFMQNRIGEASGLLIRAQEECKHLAIRPQLVRQVMRNSAAIWGEHIDARLATRAARAGRGTSEGAHEFLAARRQRIQRVAAEEARRREERRLRRFGRTADNLGWVDPTLVDALVEAGHSHSKAVAALKTANNDAAAALLLLTAPPDAAAGVASSLERGEDVAKLLSLGVPEGEAVQALATAGSLAAAMAQLGLESEAGLAPLPCSSGNSNSGGIASASAVAGSGGGGGATSRNVKETEVARQQRLEEERLFHELADGVSRDDEAHLDASLADEADAIEMYLRLASSKLPASFDLVKLAMAASRGAGSSSLKKGGN